MIFRPGSFVSVVCRLGTIFQTKRPGASCLNTDLRPFASHPSQLLYLWAKTCIGSKVFTDFDLPALAKALPTFFSEIQKILADSSQVNSACNLPALVSAFVSRSRNRPHLVIVGAWAKGLFSATGHNAEFTCSFFGQVFPAFLLGKLGALFSFGMSAEYSEPELRKL